MKALIAILSVFVSVQVMADPLPILIVSGMKSEADLVRGNGIINVIGAGNPQGLRQQLAAFNHNQIRAVVSFGVSGGLDPNLQPGALTVADRVVSDQASWPTDPALTASLRTLLANLNAGGGIIYGSDQVNATDPASRSAIFQRYGAVAVDNESHIAAEFAASQNLPFVVVRAVSDPASFTLPPAALIPLNADGTPNQNAIMASVNSDPSQLPALMQLQKDLNAATQTLQNSQKAVGFGTWAPNGLTLAF